MKWETVVGLEVHAELSTRAKAYCGCENAFGGEVNTRCCPVCTSMPGTLPVLNEQVVQYALKLGKALHCRIAPASRQDRKNYFYADLPKGYQDTQADTPICGDGKLDVWMDKDWKTIGIHRAHIEEDTAKLLHGPTFSGTLIDFNRCGVPLIEIVTRPDLRSGEEAQAFLETLKHVLAALDICDCKMQEGSIRCDVNVSVRKPGAAEYGVRVEMKNVNTFTGAKRAVEYESARQIEILEAGGTVTQETRRWDDAAGRNLSMRSKENAQDYRYFPEPDLLPIVVTDDMLAAITIPELPHERMARYMKTYDLPPFEAGLLSRQQGTFFESCVAAGGQPLMAAHWITGNAEATQITPERLAGLLQLVKEAAISVTAGKQVLSAMIQTGQDAGPLVDELGLRQVSDDGALKAWCREVLDKNEKSATDYKNGKTNALGFLVGQCMKLSGGQGNPGKFREILEAMLS